MSREELAWAAGFVDGEGHFGFSFVSHKASNSQQKIIGLSVNQTDVRALQRLREVLKLGRINGPYKYKSTHSPIWVYHIGSFEEVQSAICKLWPWLGPVKREQAKDVLLRATAYFNRPKLKRGPKPKNPFATCHTTRKHHAHGLCASCYQLAWRAKKYGK